MSEDLFDWADRSERNAVRREARRQRAARMRFLGKHKKGPTPNGTADVIDFEDERWKRYGRLLDSALAAYKRSEQRAAGALPPAPILPFDGDRKQA